MGVMGAGGVVLFSPPRIMIINSSSRLLPRCHAPTLAARLGSVTSQTGQLFLGPTPRPRSLDPPASRHRLRRSAPGQSSDDTVTGLIRESVARASPTISVAQSVCYFVMLVDRRPTDRVSVIEANPPSFACRVPPAGRSRASAACAPHGTPQCVASQLQLHLLRLLRLLRRHSPLRPLARPPRPRGPAARAQRGGARARLAYAPCSYANRHRTRCCGTVHLRGRCPRDGRRRTAVSDIRRRRPRAARASAARGPTAVALSRAFVGSLASSLYPRPTLAAAAETARAASTFRGSEAASPEERHPAPIERPFSANSMPISMQSACNRHAIGMQMTCK